jgi:uncharacterized protein (AIM24 family)
MQVVEIGLDPGAIVIAEAGVMAWTDDDIVFCETKAGDGSNLCEGFFSGRVFSYLKRARNCHVAAPALIQIG